jgi:hypothetical protein
MGASSSVGVVEEVQFIYLELASGLPVVAGQWLQLHCGTVGDAV